MADVKISDLPAGSQLVGGIMPAVQSGVTVQVTFDTMAFEAAADYQPISARLTDIAALAVTDSNFMVGNGTTWVAESGATVRTSLGLGTGDTPQFTAIDIGNASDTTLSRASAGNLQIESNIIYRAGGTDVALADGGTGASLSDPNADRILFWDDSAGAVTFLAPSAPVTITTTNLGVSTATTSAGGVVELATDAEVRASTAGTLVMTVAQVESASASVALTDAATVAVNWDNGINFTVTLGGDRTLGNPTNGQPGTWRTILITQDGTGSRTLAYGGNYVFPGGNEPVLTTAASATDRLAVFCRSTTVFEVYAMGMDLKA